MAGPSTGIVDSNLTAHLPEICEDMKIRTLVIRRPKADVIESLHKYLRGVRVDWTIVDSILTRIEKDLEYDHPLIRSIDYAQLNNSDKLRGCFDWIGVQPSRLGQLMHMRIESDLAYNLQLMARQAA